MLVLTVKAKQQRADPTEVGCGHRATLQIGTGASLGRHPTSEHQFRIEVNPLAQLTHERRLSALGLVENGEHTEAVSVIRRGIVEIEEILRNQGEVEYAEECVELQFLREWEKEVEGMRELSPREQLQADLNVAVEKEQFELAASLRDQLRLMAPTPDLPGTPPPRVS